MPKTAKHLREMPQEQVIKLRTGFNRFRFGFADVGETFSPDGEKMYEFLGNFRKQKDAKACAAKHQDTTVNGYLFGRLARGWAVWKIQNEGIKRVFDANFLDMLGYDIYRSENAAKNIKVPCWMCLTAFVREELRVKALQTLAKAGKAYSEEEANLIIMLTVGMQDRHTKWREAELKMLELRDQNDPSGFFVPF